MRDYAQLNNSTHDLHFLFWQDGHTLPELCSELVMALHSHPSVGIAS